MSHDLIPFNPDDPSQRRGKSILREAYAAWSAGHPPELFGQLHPLMEQCNDPSEQRMDLSGAFRDGEEVFAVDGCMVIRCPVSVLAPDVLAKIPAWDESRPKDLAGEIMKFGLFMDESRPLPAVPHQPPTCGHCRGTGKGGIVIGNPAPCQVCGGKGTRARSGHGVHLGANFWLDHWYVCLLNQHGAKVFPPRSAKGAEFKGVRYVVSPLQFSLPLPGARELIGYVMTFVPGELARTLDAQASEEATVDPVKKVFAKAIAGRVESLREGHTRRPPLFRGRRR